MKTHTPIYQITLKDLILDSDDRQYNIKLRDLPIEDKPREKLIKYGPNVLSLAELLAVVFGVGSKKEEILTMTKRILKEYGEKSVVNERDAKKLATSFDIPLVKACQLIACFELGRRFFEKPTGKSEYLRTAKQVFEYLTDMHNLPKEYLRGIYLNNHFKIVHDEVISIGSLTANLIHPREVFKPALEHSATAVILAHNHPSGNPTPSDNDLEITKQLIAAGKILGITLLDHIIITKNKFLSIPVKYE